MGDPFDFSMLFENLSKEPIAFISRHPNRDNHPVDWLTVWCPPEKAVVLPHRRYMTHTEIVVGRFVKDFAEQSAYCDKNPSKVVFRSNRGRVFEDATS